MTTTATHEAVLERMAEHYPRQKPLEYFQSAATRLARQVAVNGHGGVVLEPGNASRIELVVTDLTSTEVPTAYGQRFLVSIPNFQPARCAVLSGFVDEYVVANHLKLLNGDSPYVAMVLAMVFEVVA